jgi:hypothetical protein
MKKTLILLFCVFSAVMGLVPGSAQATVLSHESFTTASGAGAAGGTAADACRNTNDMFYVDGSASWSGGSVGVQGSTSLNSYGWSSPAANVTFGFLVGSTVDSLNAAYGAGNWTISNVTLTFQYTLYANNFRFNAGAGTFATYWVANDSWFQGTSDPLYTTDAATLLTWSGSQSLLASTYYSWSTASYTGTYSDLGTSAWQTDKSGDKQGTLTVSLALTSALLNDIINASAASNDKVSLYLMALSDTLGLTIFTGGSDAAGGIRPTLSFDVVSAAPVPIPPSMFLLASGFGGLALLRRRTAVRYFRNLVQSGK